MLSLVRQVSARGMSDIFLFYFSEGTEILGIACSGVWVPPTLPKMCQSLRTRYFRSGLTLRLGCVPMGLGCSGMGECLR